MQLVEIGTEAVISTAKRDAGRGGGVKSAAGIAARLRDEIVSGAIAPTERLPAERELAVLFGASRSTVREALRRLEATRHVERRVGSGTYVTYAAPHSREAIAERTSPLELFDVRMAIEPALARLAAIHATAQDLAALGAALEAAENSGGDGERFSAADEAFHIALADCARNPLMSGVYRQINEVKMHEQWRAMKRAVLVPDEIDAYNRQHRALYEALLARDPERAERAIVDHLEKARRALLRVKS